MPLFESMISQCMHSYATGIFIPCSPSSECANTVAISSCGTLMFLRVLENCGLAGEHRQGQHPAHALIKGFQAEILAFTAPRHTQDSHAFPWGPLPLALWGQWANLIQLSGVDAPGLRAFLLISSSTPPPTLIFFFGLTLKSPYSSNSFCFLNHKRA